TFLGIVPEGTLTMELSAGMSLCSSIVPQQGGISSDLGFPAADRDIVYKFSPAQQAYTIYVYYADFAEWDPAEPIISVGEAFWLDLPSARTWVRQFSISGGGSDYTVTEFPYSGGPNPLVPGSGTGTAPSITVQPEGQTNLLGSAATFTVVASGTAPLQYQWRKQSSLLPGATNSSLTIENLQGSDAGAYSVIVSNPFGSVESEQAMLRVEAIFLDGEPVVDAAFVTNSTQVEIASDYGNGAIFYTLDGSYPGTGPLYFGPFTLSTSAVLRAISYN